MRYFFLVFIFFIVQCSFSQEFISGKIVSDGGAMGEMFITNVTTNVKCIVGVDCLFTIAAKPNQVLILSGLTIERKVLILKANDFSGSLLLVKVYPKITQLAEVEIKNYPNINAVSLGIISKNVKSYTPAERKLISESSGFNIVSLINVINGRAKELKKNVAIEKKEILLDKISNFFDDFFYVNTLKIPVEYIKGFQMFVIDDPKIIEYINKSNTKVLTFLLLEKSLVYNDLQRNEKR